MKNPPGQKYKSHQPFCTSASFPNVHYSRLWVEVIFSEIYPKLLHSEAITTSIDVSLISEAEG